ncbi:4Fe-4S dicluster domain-containing protein [Peptococcaceae bacterium]|nr:4Fe-4S dicluster domain-containing protein [Peptococcaceae bacterium]
MSAGPNESKKYDSEFTKEVYETENGRWVKMCMQCGICPTTCTLRDMMDLSPRKIIQLIRAGAKDEVLKSEAIWLCTFCYNCTCRCPRGVPIMDIMADLRNLAKKAGYSKNKIYMAEAFYGDLMSRGRIWEAGVTMKYGLKIGLNNAIKMAKDMQSTGIKMLKHKRLTLLPPKGIKEPAKLRAMVEKAMEIGKGGN